MDEINNEEAGSIRRRQMAIGMALIVLMLAVAVLALRELRTTGGEHADVSDSTAVVDTMVSAETNNLVTIADTIRAGQALQLSLSRKKLPWPEVLLLVTAFNKSYDLRLSRPGHYYTVTYDTLARTITAFTYHGNKHEIYNAERTDTGFVIAKEPVYLEKAVTGAAGVVKSSLWKAMEKQGVDGAIIYNFAGIFSSQVDFLTDVREGDSFRVVYEEYLQDGKVAKLGHILAAQYKGAGTNLYAVHYRDPSGYADNYDLDGDALKKMLLRSPLDYKRISSFFTKRRFHPVLKIYRPHLGVDFAAATGTPVVSVGMGVVLEAGWSKNGYGNYIKIKHPNGYVTMYGHLSRIKKGIKRGVRVSQNQEIGYVGSTGLSSGPHLDYRMQLNGQFINPLKLNLPPAKSVEKQYKAEFSAVKDRMLQALQMFAENTKK
jgi:murein DD-endopeptidase MepM/ murein hydrolase activator NlpD